MTSVLDLLNQAAVVSQQPDDETARAHLWRMIEDGLPNILHDSRTTLFILGTTLNDQRIGVTVRGGELIVRVGAPVRRRAVSNDDEQLLVAAQRDGTTCPVCRWYTNPDGCCREDCPAYSGVPF
jgi:hypothetical protein